MFSDVQTLWQKAVTFHGHACPGLAIGCGMVMAAARYLELGGPSVDEEITCVTETDACCVDAVQALMGCTMGKGNLLLRLRGKAAMSFFDRAGNRACRVLWQGAGSDMPREEKIRFILSPQAAACFTVTPLELHAPSEARLARSLPCAACKERTAEFMLRPHEGALYCLDCWPDGSRVLS